MIYIVQQIIFVIALGITSFLVFKRINRIASNIKMGKGMNRFGDGGKRLQTMLLIAFGQQKMFDKPLVGFMHFIIYAGFLLVNIEVLEIVIDGIAGTHRVFAPFLGGFYTFLISFFEFLAVSVIAVCVVFLVRRNVLKLPRFWKAEMTAWPRMDANIILGIEIVLMLAILTMNASDSILQGRGEEHYYKAGIFAFSQFFIPVLNGLDDTSLIVVERFGWWFHILGVMFFSIYVTYSKHLHIFLAFPNTYFSNLQPKGLFENMPAVTKEVKLALGLIQDDGVDAGEIKFGAKDVADLTWKNLMDAYSCTECGRCTAQCPANQTGKKLSPRKIMMDTRDRLEEIGKYRDGGKSVQESLETGETLYSDQYISKEEIMACTTCNACVDACPINIDPLSIIIEIRRHIAMEETGTPAQWNSMFSNIENNMAPWKFSPMDRFNWANEINS